MSYLLNLGDGILRDATHQLHQMVKRFMARHSRTEVDRRAPFAEPAPTLLTEVKRVMPRIDGVQYVGVRFAAALDGVSPAAAAVAAATIVPPAGLTTCRDPCRS